MKAIVLVGGEGTRLRPLTYTTPKPLLPIANVAFLERQLEWLASHGVDEAILSLGYMPDAFMERFPDGRSGSIALRYVVESEPLGTAGAIRFAAEGLDERVVVCNGDVLTTLDLTAMIEFHEAADAEATIALTRVDDPSRFGVVPTRDGGAVVAFVEKPPKGKAPTDWINAGTYILEQSVIERIPGRLNVSIERATFPRMLEDGGRLFAVQSDAYWLDIGTPEAFLRGNADVLSGRIGGSIAPGAIERSPGIWTQGEVVIDPEAELVAPVLLGAGSVISSRAHIENSVVGAGCRIGRGARIVRSVVLDRACLGTQVQVVDSVVGAAAVLEDRALVADVTIVGEKMVVSAGAKVAGERLHASPA